MKSIYLLIYFLFCYSELILPQEALTAFITNPQIGSEKGETYLNSVSRDIQQRDEIKTRKLSASSKSNYQLISVSPFSNIEFISEVDSSVIVFYKENLTTNWQVEIGVKSESGILLNSDRVFTADNNGIIKCLKNDGKEKWYYETNSAIKTNLLLHKDLIVAATTEGDLFTINSNNGDLVQVIGTGETISTNIAMIDIIYNDMKTKGIIFGTTADNIYCYELYSLEMLWDSYLPDYKISSLFKANNDKIIFQDDKEKIYCTNSSNGLLIWEWQAKVKKIKPYFVSDIISDGNSVYLADSDGLVHCIDLLLGTENWKRKNKSTGKISLSHEKKYLITQTTKNEITFISRLNGKVQRKIKLTDEVKEEKLIFIKPDKDDIYLGYENGILYRLNNKNKVEKILYMGNSPLISFNKVSDNKFIVSNLDGRLIQFSFR